MKQPKRPKTDNLGWISALIFPKKSKSAPAAAPRPPAVTTPKPATPPAWVKTPAASSSKPKPALQFQPGKLLPAFWTVASVLSFITNVILIAVLLGLGQELFALKTLVGKGLVGGLYENFILMDQAHIKTNIAVADNVPINFNLAISQDTVVTLTQPTRINGAQVSLTSGGVAINSPANITLPAGTNLPVHLELTVPVNTTVPITINVPVDIPLEKTDLHKPFIGLQQVVSPYYWLLQPQINGPADLDACRGLWGWMCGLVFH
jgi:hypothetical protein